MNVARVEWLLRRYASTLPAERLFTPEQAARLRAMLRAESPGCTCGDESDAGKHEDKPNVTCVDRLRSRLNRP